LREPPNLHGGLTGDSADITYFEVDAEISMGLPEAARAGT
jgi:hypothetical protein